MNLDRVTITGADDSVRPGDLLRLSKQYPFVEWGILVSARQMGAPRFPSEQWIADLAAAVPADFDARPKLSMHVCGVWVRELLQGRPAFPIALLRAPFQRMQLNFHADALRWDAGAFAESLEYLSDAYGPYEYIFQVDGNQGLQIMHDAIERAEGLQITPLFDLSHGAGVLPKEWPLPLNADIYHGYAGGLGHDNLAEQIPLIGAAAGDHRIWIDMETKVRSNGDRQFDLEKVERCLELAAPFVTEAAAIP